MTTDYRYPGSRSFQDTDLDRKLFFGRDTEKDELLHLILAEKLVVLFAKSGLGKTSLLNAGVLQPLRERGFCPINIRLNDPNLTPLQTVYAAIPSPPQSSCESGISWLKRPAENQSGLQPASALRPAIDGWTGDASTQNGEGGEGCSLLQYFTTAEFWSQDDTLLTPVLIFDQFEEFFAFHKPEDRLTFIAQLAEALKGQTAQPLLKVIIALREDALGQLKDLSAELPDIFRNLFRLDYLPRAQARQAIIAPAQLADAEIGMLVFQYAPEAVDAMLDFLCKQQQKQNTVLTDEVEPAQLQLLCQHVEQNVRKRQTHADAAIVVQKSDLGGERGMQEIVQQFYDRQLKRLRSFWQRRKVRKLCEKGLLSKTNRRLSLAEEDIGRRFKVSPKLLARLIDSRLLRAENRGSGRVYYELSHDTLILPIRKSQRQRKIRNWSVGMPSVFLLLFIAFLLLITIEWNYQFARIRVNWLATAEQFFAEEHYYLGCIFYRYALNAEAEEQYRKAVMLNPQLTDAYRLLGSALHDQQKFDEALMQYEKVLELDPTKTTMYVWIGNTLEAQGKYDEAIIQYQKTVELNPDWVWGYTAVANAVYQQGKFDEARHWYRQAYAAAERTYQRHQKEPTYTNYFAAYNLIVEQIEQAYVLAQDAEREMNQYFWRHPSLYGQAGPDGRLYVRFMFVTCLIYQHQRTEALTELKSLIKYYHSIKEMNEKWMDYGMFHNVIEMSDKLTDTDKTLLLKLIDVLQAPKAEGDRKLNELEAMLPELLQR